MKNLTLFLVALIQTFIFVSLQAEDRSFLEKPSADVELLMDASEDGVDLVLTINGRIYEKDLKEGLKLTAIPLTYSAIYTGSTGQGKSDVFKISAASLNGEMFLKGDGPGNITPKFRINYLEYEKNNNDGVNSFISVEELSYATLNLSLDSQVKLGNGEIIFNMTGLTKAILDGSVKVKDSNEEFDFDGFSFSGSVMLGYNFKYKGHSFPCKAETSKKRYKSLGGTGVGEATVSYTRYSCSTNLDHYLVLSVAHDETRTEYDSGSFLRKRSF